jgi:GDP-L-fucose synthase
MKNILVTGGSGMVGLSLQKLIPDAIFVGSKDFDLRNKEEVSRMFSHHKPEYVIHLAAKVGGVKANKDFLADFYYENTMINTNVLDCAREHGVKKLLSLLSTCIYPDNVTYPLMEKNIHEGEPHESNFAYAYAKRMLDVQSRAYREQHGCNFITAVPNNLFGENDNFDYNNSHVIPAIIRKVYEAKLNKTNVVLWGDGSPLREFTYSADLAKILLFLLEKYNGATPINVGNTEERSIKEVTKVICDILEYDGPISWDSTKPAGQHKKPSDNSKLLDLGWKKEEYSNFYNSIKNVCHWFQKKYPVIRGYQIN